MPLKYQEVLFLRFSEKRKLSEIALILDKKEGTVKSLLSRGLAKLRKALNQAETQPSAGSDIITIEGRRILNNPLEQYEE